MDQINYLHQAIQKTISQILRVQETLLVPQVQVRTQLQSQKQILHLHLHLKIQIKIRLHPKHFTNSAHLRLHPNHQPQSLTQIQIQIHLQKYNINHITLQQVSCFHLKPTTNYVTSYSNNRNKIAINYPHKIL
jgi:hypothetical protein